MQRLGGPVRRREACGGVLVGEIGVHVTPQGGITCHESKACGTLARLESDLVLNLRCGCNEMPGVGVDNEVLEGYERTELLSFVFPRAQRCCRDAIQRRKVEVLTQHCLKATRGIHIAVDARGKDPTIDVEERRAV